MNIEKKLTTVEILESAVWMVGNMDTPEDKAAWWKEFRGFYNEYFMDNPVNAERAQTNFDLLCQHQQLIDNTK